MRMVNDLRRQRLPAAAALLMSVTACVHAARVPAPVAVVAPKTIEATPAHAWDEAMAALAELGYRVVSVDERRGQIVAEREQPEARIGEYAREPVARAPQRWWSLQVTLMVALREQAGGYTQLRVDSRLQARGSAIARGKHQPSGFSEMPMTSTGLAELEFLHQLGARITPPAPAA